MTIFDHVEKIDKQIKVRKKNEAESIQLMATGTGTSVGGGMGFNHTVPNGAGGWNQFSSNGGMRSFTDDGANGFYEF